MIDIICIFLHVAGTSLPIIRIRKLNFLFAYIEGDSFYFFHIQQTKNESMALFLLHFFIFFHFLIISTCAKQMSLTPMCIYSEFSSFIRTSTLFCNIYQMKFTLFSNRDCHLLFKLDQKLSIHHVFRSMIFYFLFFTTPELLLYS